MTAIEIGLRMARWIATFVVLIPLRIVLHDHVRLPGRFFGRMTATAQAQL
jgi:hypothetical protein